jgi:hypothetical protein
MDRRYAFERHPYSGLLIISYQGVKIGSAQTEAAARLIIRNHKRRNMAPAR